MAKRRRNKKEMDSVGRLALGLAVLLTLYLYYLSPFKESFQGLGLFLAFVISIVLAAVFATIVRPLSKRKSQEPEQPATFSFDAPYAMIPHKEFEYEVARIISQLTGHETRVTGGARDGGVDIEVYNVGRRVGIVQCKRYKPNVALPPDHIRSFFAVKQRERVNSAYLVTTARFSPDSVKLAQQLGIRLVDGAMLERMRQNAQLQHGYPPVQPQLPQQPLPPIPPPPTGSYGRSSNGVWDKPVASGQQVQNDVNRWRQQQPPPPSANNKRPLNNRQDQTSEQERQFWEDAERWARQQPPRPESGMDRWRRNHQD